MIIEVQEGSNSEANGEESNTEEPPCEGDAQNIPPALLTETKSSESSTRPQIRSNPVLPNVGYSKF